MPAFEKMVGDASHGPRDTRSRALLIGVIVALLGSAPGLRAQSDKAPSKPAAVEKTKAVAELEPFDLSYVPVEAKSLIAFRPAAIFRRDDMKHYGVMVQELTSHFITEDVGFPVAIKLESIDQVIFELTRLPHSKGEERRDEPHDPFCLSIRFTEAVDWREPDKGYLAKSGVEWVKVAFEGKSYFRVREPDAQLWGDVKAPCFFLPNARTFVLADQESLHALIRRPAREVPEPARGSGWQEISRDLIAFATANNGPVDELDDLSEVVLEILMDILHIASKNPCRLSCGMDGGETLRFRISEGLDGAKEASAAALERIEQIAGARLTMAVAPPGAEAEIDKADGIVDRLMQELTRNGQVRRDGRTVDIVTRCKASSLPELMEAFARLFIPFLGDLDMKAVGGDLETRTPGKDQKPVER